MATQPNPRRSLYYYAGLTAMGLFYIASGINHFRNTGFYRPIMPPYIPAPVIMIYISGVAEMLGGVAVLVPRTRAVAAWGIVALLIAVSPVHINMCLHPDKFANIPLWIIWFRLPLQFVFMAWAWYYTLD